MLSLDLGLVDSLTKLQLLKHFSCAVRVPVKVTENFEVAFINEMIIASVEIDSPP